MAAPKRKKKKIVICKTCPWAIEVKSEPEYIQCRNAKINTGGRYFGLHAPACPEHPKYPGGDR